MPTPETYRQLIEAFNIDKWEGYERIRKPGRQEYESLRYTHNLDTNHNNVWRSQKNAMNGKQHPTQKPTDIIERIIKNIKQRKHNRIGLFMGSGRTAYTCLQQKLHRV